MTVLYTFIFLTLTDMAQQHKRNNDVCKWQQSLRECATMLRYMYASTYSARLQTKLMIHLV